MGRKIPFLQYTLVAKREGVDNLSWQILLHMGILYVNLSCHYHCGQRLLLYTTGMMFLEKYGLRRGMCPEVPYNKGRAAHLYGDNAEAIGFYLDCLTLCHKTKIQAVPTEGTLMDYAFLAAYNLRAVYIRLKQPVQVKDLYDTILRWDKVKPRVLSKWTPECPGFSLLFHASTVLWFERRNLKRVFFICERFSTAVKWLEAVWRLTRSIIGPMKSFAKFSRSVFNTLSFLLLHLEVHRALRSRERSVTSAFIFLQITGPGSLFFR